MILNTLHLQYSCLEAGKDWESTTLLSSLYHSLHCLSQFLISSFHMPEDIYCHSPRPLLLEIHFL